MTSSVRTLRQDFVDFMHMCKGWPKTQAFERWMREKGGIRNGIYSAMTRGLAVDPRFAVGLAEYFLARLKSGKITEEDSYFKQYLASLGILDPLELSASSIANKILAADDKDYIARGFAGIFDAFKGSRFVEATVQGCKNEKQIREAIHWLFVAVGRETAPRDATSIDDAVAIAEATMKTSMEEYEKRVLRWWNFDPWTVVLSRGKRGPTGMCIVLPLDEMAYESIRDGKTSIEKLQPADLVRPSRFLFIEALAQRPMELGGDGGNTTRNLLSTIFSQGAILSHLEGEKGKKPLHLLTRGGTPQSIKRAKSLGYKLTGNKMRDEGIDSMERVFQWPYSVDEMVFIGLRSVIGNFADRFLTPPDRAYRQRSRENGPATPDIEGLH